MSEINTINSLLIIFNWIDIQTRTDFQLSVQKRMYGYNLVVQDSKYHGILATFWANVPKSDENYLLDNLADLGNRYIKAKQPDLALTGKEVREIVYLLYDDAMDNDSVDAEDMDVEAVIIDKMSDYAQLKKYDTLNQYSVMAKDVHEAAERIAAEEEDYEDAEGESVECPRCHEMTTDDTNIKDHGMCIDCLHDREDDPDFQADVERANGNWGRLTSDYDDMDDIDDSCNPFVDYD